MEGFVVYLTNLAELSAYDSDTRALLVGWMTVYALTGEEPDFASDNPARYVWPIMKSKADRAKEEYQRKSNAGKAGGRPPKQTENQTETEEQAEEKQTESRQKAEPKQTESRTKANKKPESESDTESESEPDPKNVKHTRSNRQQSDAGARVREEPVRKIWFDPSSPDTWADQSWRSSGRVRYALAQRIVDYARARGLNMTPTPAGDGAHLIDVMVAAMEVGTNPADFVRLLDGTESCAEWEDHMIYRLGMLIGSTTMAETYPEWYDRCLDLGMWQTAGARR